MDKIISFQKDHNTLQPGFYLSNQMQGVTTYDLRFVKPNAGRYLSTASAHSIEHMLATVLRNSPQKEHIIYFGPMGCRTGFYLLTVGLEKEQVKALLLAAIQQALALTEVPGAAKVECGNYLDHSLSEAREDLSSYLALLKQQ